MGAKPFKKLIKIAETYSEFDQLDGSHPWMSAVPEGYIAYPVRELGKGEIAYFNFALAKEMGLIDQEHSHLMTTALKDRLLKTFSLQIINEYDQIHQKKFDPLTIKKNKYMASRYLQLQHSSKTGKTSGDGRGIWNGTIENKGKTWDVSSRGTGVTQLAPGSAVAKKPLKTGGTDFGYGCGQAEIDELYGAAILAELMHLQGVPTERVLCIIYLEKGYGIGVRAAPNLLRPAHLFLYLKQDRFEDVKRSVDYFIDRQIKNGKWIIPRGKNKYDFMAREISRSYAEFTATLDIDYIFAWLDWDGDNVLADAGIIDYGSVRQFGIRHDRYRYDDVERFSTNLTEQKSKAKLIVQVFCQLLDFAKNAKKKPLASFANDPAVTAFDEHFKNYRANRLLYRAGFSPTQRENILKEKGLFEMFDSEFSYFEKAKISGSIQKVPDGINHPALFDVRSILKTLPEKLLKKGFQDGKMSDEEFFKIGLSVFAKSKDTKLRPKHRRHIENFQRIYKLLVIAAAGKQNQTGILPELAENARILNREDRITGNALIQIVFEIIEQTKRGLPYSDVQKLIDQLIYAYVGTPEVSLGKFYDRKPRILNRTDIFAKFLDLIDEHKHDI